ncbi:Protein of unknown function DUF812 [Cynara cardunculus var. scolymus]|uniref:Coiled-coil domain-containing protein 22 n=1 Tax=Cynara cardunculus var. scolymus TaxID=59895 RepID=A0A103YJN5_CYNCS|nr:Protein of unknown function DUF812 [Cynara cardunculus var. scolymus]
MEESQEILLNSLANAGVPIPPEVLSVEDLAPETLVSICAHSLRIISNSESFPITLPDSMADRFKICTDLASSVKDLGYIGDMSFHKFLYPSEEDMYKLIRFLVGRLSESSTTAVSPNAKDLHTKVEDLNLRSQEAVSNSIQYAEKDIAADDINRDGKSNTDNVGLSGMENGISLTEDTQYSRNSAGGDRGTSHKTEMLLNQENVTSDEVTAKSLELQRLEEQHDLLKAAVEMACDEQNSVDSYIVQLTEQRKNLEEALCAKQPESHEKHRKWKKLEQDTESLSTEIEKLPKLATRRSYIERIKEITKNSRKQDIDIERILKETRELQLESNMIQERLHRTYAVVDETLLSFEEISEKILATDRARREATELETKLSRIGTQSLNVAKLEADLDAIRKENEYLQSHTQLGNP